MFNSQLSEKLTAVFLAYCRSLTRLVAWGSFASLVHTTPALAIMGEALDPADEPRFAGACRLHVLERGLDAQNREQRVSLAICTGSLIDEESFPASLRAEVSQKQVSQNPTASANSPQRSRYLLTAAHCDPSLPRTPNANAASVLGELKNPRRMAVVECRGYNSQGQPTELRSEVAAFFRNPDWKANEERPTLANAAKDLGVLRLAEPIAIGPVYLPEPDSSRAFISGHLTHYCAAAGVGEDRYGRVGRINIVQIPRELPARIEAGLVSAQAIRMASDFRGFEVRPGDSGGPIFCNPNLEASPPTIFAVHSVTIETGGLIGALLASRDIRMTGFSSVLVEQNLPLITRGFRAVQPRGERPALSLGDRVRRFWGD
jgi:hypothetical protein